MLLGYFDRNRSLPAYRHHELVDGKRKPVELSWRVSILPYAGHKMLYQKFKLTEPWDSPHNKKLIGEMPRMFGLLPEETEKGLTRYRTFVGQGLVFTPGGYTSPPQTIFDGSDYTILVAEAAEAVPWTKPDEMMFDFSEITARKDLSTEETRDALKGAFWKAPLPKLGGAYRGSFHVLNASAQVIEIRQDVEERLLRMAIHPFDKERFQWKELMPR